MKRRAFGLGAYLFAAVLIMASPAHGADPPADGGGDGGSGGAPPTSPPNSYCYMSFGGASNFNIIDTSPGPGGMKVSLHWSLPQENSYKLQTRVVASGADGSITYDSGWIDMTPFLDETIPGGSYGDSTNSMPGDTDISGGLMITDRFTNQEGQTSDEWGESIPPDPVTGTC